MDRTPAPHSRVGTRLLAVLAAALVAACQSAPVIPSLPDGKTPAAPGALDACDPAGYVACVTGDAVASVPIPGTGLALTWSSVWAPGRQGRPDWDASSLGLAGWSIDAVEGYAAADGILVDGDGSWRFASPVSAGNGETAVPTWDASTAFVFDPSGRHVRSVDGRLGTTLLTIAYDSLGRLAAVKGSLGNRAVGLAVRRDSDGRPSALIGLDGGSVGVVLDPQGRLSEIDAGGGHVTAFEWLPGDLLGTETDAMGAMTRFTYDGNGRLATQTDPDGVTTTYVRTATDASVTETAATTLGRTTTYRTATGAGGSITRTYVGPDGATTSEVQDGSGSLSLAYPDGSRLVVTVTASGSWKLDAPVLARQVRTRVDGVTTTATVAESLQHAAVPYAVSGSVTTTIDGQAWVTKYDSAARMVSLADPAGRTATRTYDTAGRLVAAADPGRPPVAIAYDATGRETTETVGTGGAAQTTRFVYDTSTGRVAVTRPDGSVVSESIDAMGNPVGWAAADGTTTLASYDAAGHLVGIQPPGALGFTLGSSAGGRATGFLSPSVGGDGATETTTYDADGRAASFAGPAGRAVTTRYDGAGRFAGWTGRAGATTFGYDGKTGLVATSATPAAVSTAYSYAGPTLAGLRWSGLVSGSVTTTVDGGGRTTSVAVDGGQPLPRTYDVAGLPAGVGDLRITREPSTGLVTRETLGSIETDRSYDALERLARSTTTAAGTTVLDRTYTYDALGRVATVAETGTDGTVTTAYRYDGSDRLTGVTAGGATIESDAYDPAGNRVAVTTQNGTLKAGYDDRQRLTTWGAASYRWSGDGTLGAVTAPGGDTSLSFDDAGRLQAVTLPDGRAVTYEVDADGRRVGRLVDGRLVAGYLYDPSGQIVASTDGNGAVVERFGYDDAGHLALVLRGDATYAVVTDQVGTPRLVLDSSTGSVADAIAYDAWGRVTSETHPDFIPLGFAGGLRDSDTGLVHFAARDYDTVTGRWISSDPVRFAGGDANLYRYSGGDPIDRTDPSGLCDQDLLSHGAVALGYALYGPLGALNGYTFGRCPPEPPPPPPPSVPTLHCWGLYCDPRPGNPGTPPGTPLCHWAVCDFNPDGSFRCIGLGCIDPNGRACFVGLCWYGDTHLLTGDGTHVDFQAAGEFVAARSPDGGIQVQVRQEPILGGTTITFGTAVAAGVDGDRVGVYAAEPSFLVVNGVPATAADLAERLPHGGSVERHGGTVTIDWPDASRLFVFRVGHTLALAFSPSAAVRASLRGLFGNADGNAANDLTGRDGAVLARDDADFGRKLYTQFGDGWRLRPDESLFDYQTGESTATFTRRDIPSSIVTAATLAAELRSSAEAVCRAVGVRRQPFLDDCILDVAETGDSAFAAAEARLAAGPISPVAAPTPGPDSSASPTPTPTQSPTAAGPIALGQHVSGKLSTTAARIDYTFTGTAGQVVYLHTDGGCVNGLEWVLLGPNGAAVAMGPGTCQEIGRVALPGAGKYSIRMQSDGRAIGAYGFVVLAVPPTPSDAISVGQDVSGLITSPGGWHEYTFVATPGQQIEVSAPACGAASALQLRLIGPDGALVDFHTACGTMGPDRLPAAGTYTIRVFGDGFATGPYSFTLRPAP